MTPDPDSMKWVYGGGAVVTLLLIIAMMGDDPQSAITRRMERFSDQGPRRKIKIHDRENAVRKTSDSSIPLLNQIVRILPNPDKLRQRLARTGKNLTLGEYFLINMLVGSVLFLLFNLLGWAKMVAIPFALMLGFGLPHFIVGMMGARRIKKFLATFPEAIDTMTRSIRSGLPVTEAIASVGREMPDPVGLEFNRIADGVRVGKTLEAAMWDIARRIDSPEYRFLIIAMAIQKETGGNLAETLGNLSDLIRRRRQLRLKIKAMSSEAMASAMIIGSLPFIMFILLMIVNSEYMMTMFQSFKGRFMLGAGVTWMGMGWATMAKMVRFEI
jgi:tight adherence protein B